MRSIVLATLTGALMLVVAPAQAHHHPNSYCSQSGDVCASARMVDGERVFQINTAAKYFGDYRVCVIAPDESKTCRNGHMRDGNDDGVWTGRMKWADRFPNGGRGAYTVRWTAEGYRSPRLGFHN